MSAKYMPCTTTVVGSQLLTKEELREKLQSGLALGDILPIGWGQMCPIFKSDHFTPGAEILYIPDLWLNELPYTRPANNEEIEDILSHCYTGDDFVYEMDGDHEKAESLFWYCDWQNISSAVQELED